jgi:hypothetical protein
MIRAHGTLMETFGANFCNQFVWNLVKYTPYILVLAFLKLRTLKQFDSSYFLRVGFWTMIKEIVVKAYFYLGLSVLGGFLLVFEFSMSFNIEAEMRAFIFIVPFFGICLGVEYVMVGLVVSKWCVFRVMRCMGCLDSERDSVDDEVDIQYKGNLERENGDSIEIVKRSVSSV